MTLYEPRVKLDPDEWAELQHRLRHPTTNPRAVEALRRARRNHGGPY